MFFKNTGSSANKNSLTSMNEMSNTMYQITA